jgi:tripartite-type tricarboxylate transporter receptor subunit TctC
MPPSIEYVRAGKRRALAVTSATRSEALPDLPTVGEFLPGYEASLVTGLGVPRNTPAEIIDRVNREPNSALTDPRIKAQFADLGNTRCLGRAPVGNARMFSSGNFYRRPRDSLAL